MNIKKLIPLILILGVLVGLVVVRKNTEKKPSLVTQANLETLAQDALEAKEVSRLVLFAGPTPDEKVVLKREDDMWAITSQFGAPAKKEVVEDYLDDLLALKGEFRAKADSDEQLDAYQLKGEQAFHVQAFTGDAETPALEVLFGKAPNHSSVLMRKSGDKTVYVESKNLRTDAGVWGDDMAKAPEADKWLDKVALDLDKEKITKVALTLPDKSVVLQKEAKEVEVPTPAAEGEGEATPAPEKKVEYEWKVASGGYAGQTPKDKAIKSILLKLDSLTAANVVDPAKKAEWGLDAPLFKAVVSVEGEEADTVVEGGRPDLSGNGYVRVANAKTDIVYEINDYNFTQLFPKGADLFELPALGINQTAISRVEIEQPEGRVVVEKSGAEWKVLEPAADLEVQKPALDGIANALGAWKAADYADAGTQAGDFARKVTVMANGITKTLYAGGPSKNIDGVYARLEGSDAVLAMSQADLKKIFLTPKDVYQLSVLDFVLPDVKQLEAQVDGVAFRAVRGTADWTVTKAGDTFTVSSESMDNLLSMLEAFEVANVHVGETELLTPKVQVALTLQSGARIVLGLGELQGTMHLMQVEGKSGLFEAAQTDVAALLAQLTTVSTKPEAEAPASKEAGDAAEEQEEAAVTVEMPTPEKASVEPSDSPAPAVVVETPAS